MDLLTTKTEIINNQFAFLQQNAGNDPELIGAIFEAEINFLEPLLGHEMYKDMLNIAKGVNSNYTVDPIVKKFSAPENENYEILWREYLIKLMSLAATTQSLPYLAAKITNSGISNPEAYNSNALSIEDAERIQNKHLKTVNRIWYSTEEFLCRNKANYPKFNTKNCTFFCCKDDHKETENKSNCCNDGKLETKIFNGIIMYKNV